MTVIVNEAAIVALSESPPVAAFVERVASRVVTHAQTNVSAYFWTAPTLDVDQDVGLSMRGSSAVIGIRPAGHKAELLARYQAHGNSNGVVDWLLEALDQTQEERVFF